MSDIDFERIGNSLVYRNSNKEVLAEINFPNTSDNIIDINRTFVSKLMEGQGIGSQLVQSVAEIAKVENLKITPTCEFAESWFEKHPEYDEILN